MGIISDKNMYKMKLDTKEIGNSLIEFTRTAYKSLL